MKFLFKLSRLIHRALPENMKGIVKPISDRVYRLLNPELRGQRNWYRKYYGTTNLRQREELFISLARFMNVNRPYTGYYMEFGCHSGTTMKLAWKHFRWLFDFEYLAFDSFEGLPEIAEIDEMSIWSKGRLKTDEIDFRRIVTKSGLPQDKLQTIKGCYIESLTDHHAHSLSQKSAAVIYIDCDLYESAVSVLDFARHFLTTGTIIVFDDWNCFFGDPNRGERRAFTEFQQKYPELRFSHIMATPEAST